MAQVVLDRVRDEQGLEDDDRPLGWHPKNRSRNALITRFGFPILRGKTAICSFTEAS